jgi:hypothetical protein
LNAHPLFHGGFRSALQNDDASSRDIFLSALRAILIFTLISIFN